jgi:hypothetical protein
MTEEEIWEQQQMRKAEERRQEDAEMERLEQERLARAERLRLTDAEREALDAGADALESIAANDNDGRIRAALLIAANTLRGFLKRTG